MWTDYLTTNVFLDDNVKVKREISSPATPDEITLTFSDGSRLFVRVEVDPPAEVDSEGEAAELAERTTAFKVFGKLIEAVYSRATEKRLDLDMFRF